MTWIKTLPPTAEHPEVRQALREGMENYPPEYRPEARALRQLPQAVQEDSITLAHSLLPGPMRHAFALFGYLMDPALPLGRRQHELIAVAVSVANQCFY